MVLDPQLVAAARDGDDNAFEALYAAIYKELYRAALYMLDSPEDAEDVVSETVLEAYKGLKNLRNEHLFRAWILKILHARAKRKKAVYVQNKNLTDIDELDEVLADHAHGDTTELIALREALMKLNETDRAAVILHSYLGYNGAEIAKILGCPHGTVNSRISRAHKKLREMLT